MTKTDTTATKADPATILFYDVETTGLPDWHTPSDDPVQPHVCQLAAILTDAAGATLSAINLMIRPDGWTIPEELAELHGITTERALLGGVPVVEALALFQKMADAADLRVGHNESFDARLMRIQYKRNQDVFGDYFESWKGRPAFCTMRKATDLCKLPPTAAMLAANRRHFKSPTLDEAYRHFFGQPFANAHNAMADCVAVRHIYFEIVGKPAELLPAAPAPAAAPAPQQPPAEDDAPVFLHAG